MKKQNSLFIFLSKKPVSFLAAFYLITITLIVILGMYYIGNNNYVLQNRVPPMLSDSLFIVPELTAKEPQTLAAIDIKSLSQPTPDMIARGKQTFSTVCASCHGAEGKGDGIAGAALNPKPRNFYVPDGWKNGRKVSEMFKTLQFGLSGSGMPAYDNMPPAERIDVISYIRATFMQGAPLDSPSEIDAMDKTYKLSAGVEQPGQLPVQGAAVLLERAEGGLKAKIVPVLDELNSAGNSEQGLVLLKKVSYRPELALALFAKNMNQAATVDAFRAMVRDGIGRNGFSPAFNLLEDSEVLLLYNTLKQKLS